MSSSSITSSGGTAARDLLAHHVSRGLGVGVVFVDVDRDGRLESGDTVLLVNDNEGSVTDIAFGRDQVHRFVGSSVSRGRLGDEASLLALAQQVYTGVLDGGADIDTTLRQMLDNGAMSASNFAQALSAEQDFGFVNRNGVRVQIDLERGGAVADAWDVFFDRASGTRVQQRSPIVLDLNRNGAADITGANILGDGVLGHTVSFDLDLQDRQWKYKTQAGRPALRLDRHEIDAANMDAWGQNGGQFFLPRGTQITIFEASGAVARTLSAESVRTRLHERTMGLGLQQGQRADFRDAAGRLIGELRWDTGPLINVGNITDRWVFMHGNVNRNEWTSAWGASGGDGLLVWDVDGDGRITSGIELFGHVDTAGRNTFANGYEKLSHYFDRNRDGRVEGAELQGLQIWEDRNGNATVEAGELVGLEVHDIRALTTSFDASSMHSRTLGVTAVERIAVHVGNGRSTSEVLELGGIGTRHGAHTELHAQARRRDQLTAQDQANPDMPIVRALRNMDWNYGFTLNGGITNYLYRGDDRAAQARIGPDGMVVNPGDWVHGFAGRFDSAGWYFDMWTNWLTVIHGRRDR